jgi:hypothetical protein
MLKRTMTAVLTVTLLVTAGSAMAQCVIGVYADAAGTVSAIDVFQFQEFDVYVVIHNEASVEGASYALETPPGTAVQQIPHGSGIYGPNGNGLSIVSPGGENVGFQSCAIGFGGQPVLVARYVSRAFGLQAVGGEYRVLANPDEGASPVHATCNGFLLDCPNLQSLLITGVIATESKSFGAVKSLY